MKWSEGWRGAAMKWKRAALWWMRGDWFCFPFIWWVSGGSAARLRQREENENKNQSISWINKEREWSSFLLPWAAVHECNEWMERRRRKWTQRRTKRKRGKPTPAPINLSLWRRLMELAAVASLFQLNWRMKLSGLWPEALYRAPFHSGKQKLSFISAACSSSLIY